MADAFIIDGARSPIGRIGGALAGVRPDDLAAHILKSLMVRHPKINWTKTDEVVLGCTNQAGEDSRNLARHVGLLAGLPETVAGLTVNRLCGSGAAAILDASRAIRCDEGDLFVAGGCEVMSRAPWVMAKAAPRDAAATAASPTRN